MRLTILTVGSRGDVQPYLGLGLGLKAAGYTVTIAAHPPFERFIRERGLDYAPIAGDPRQLLGEDVGQAWLASGRNPVAFIRHLRRLAEPLARQLFHDTELACRAADAILYPVLGTLAAISIAEKLRLPAFPAYLQHYHPSAAFPNAMARPLPPQLGPALSGWYNRCSQHLVAQIFWQTARSLFQRWRQETLHLPPFPFLGPFGALGQPGQPFFYGYSPTVLPKPADWPHSAHVTGYWFLDALSNWQPPPELADFLASGPPPVYIGFGSMADRNAPFLTKTALAALQRTGQRGLLLAGWGGLSNADLPDQIYKIDAAPHDWLFPRMAAVVHHGGAGTTAAGLRAGIPTLIIPFMGDQAFWGWRVAEIGAGPPAIPRQRLTVERLAAGIQEAIENRGIRRQAAEIGRRIRAENGIGRVVELLTRYL